MITSPQNEKLKMVRKLASRRGREREGLFVTEGEDLVAAGIEQGVDPRFVLAEPGYDGPGSTLATEVERALLDEVSSLGSGSRVIAVWPQRWGVTAGPVCLYMDGVADPGNVGAVIRSHGALVEGSVVLGEGCADPYGPKAVRAAMGALFALPPARGSLEATPRPRIALVASGGSWPMPITGQESAVTLCLGAEREGVSDQVLADCDATVTIPIRPEGPESLNLAAAAAICCERVSSHAVFDARTGSGSEGVVE